MNRYFVICAVGMLMVVFSALANAETNLQIVLEGPFAVCEDPTAHTLTIYVPNLEKNHFVPGFTTLWDELPLGKPKYLTQYQVYPHHTDYRLDSPWPGSKTFGNMDIRAPVDSHDQKVYQKVYLYQEKRDCTKRQVKYESVSLTVPDPDEIWALERAGELSSVTEDKLRTKFTGPCQKSSCRYATRVVLRYLGIDPKKIEIYSGNSPDCGKGNRWCPADLLPIGNEIEIGLDVQPLPTKNAEEAHSQSAEAFALATKLLGAERHLHYDNDKSNPTNDWVTTHNDCHGALIFFCKTGTACDQHYLAAHK